MSQVATSLSIEPESPSESFRPTPWLWLGVVLYVLAQGSVLASVTMHLGTTRPDIGGIIVALLIVFLPAIAIIPLRIAKKIQVTADTLQWRTWRGSFSAPWSDVTDYYQTTQKDNQMPTAWCVVVTSVGKCHFEHGGALAWSHSDRLREQITQRAMNARAHRWEMLGARREIDWPRTFDYKTPLHRWVLPLLVTLCLVCSALILKSAIPVIGFIIKEQMSRLGWGWDIGSILFMAPFYLVLVGYPMMGLAGIIILWKTWNSRLTLSEDGILYKGWNSAVKARWSEVTGLRSSLMGMRTVVKTTQGSFSILSTIRDYYSI